MNFTSIEDFYRIQVYIVIHEFGYRRVRQNDVTRTQSPPSSPEIGLDVAQRKMPLKTRPDGSWPRRRATACSRALIVLHVSVGGRVDTAQLCADSQFRPFRGCKLLGIRGTNRLKINNCNFICTLGRYRTVLTKDSSSSSY